MGPTGAVHEGDVTHSLFMVDQGSDLGPTGVDVTPLDEEFLGDVLIRNDDEGLASHTCLVNRSMDICPLLELPPHGKSRQIMDSAYDGELLRPREFVLGLFLLSP